MKTKTCAQNVIKTHKAWILIIFGIYSIIADIIAICDM